MKSALLLTALLSAPLTAAYADGGSMPMQMPGGGMPMQAARGHDMAMPMAEGVVRRIDLDNGKITLKHGPIASIDMPPMTMVYRVQSASLLEGLKVGDRVRFDVEDRDGVDTVTRIERQP
ncbi:MAG: copper-binding protein [Hyphomicrobiaceae bacterium]